MKTTPYVPVALAAGLALLGLSSPARAQTPSPDAPASDQEQVVQMSVFEVQGTANQGYASHESASGLKTNMPLEDIPQSMAVVTNDLLKDVGETHEGLGYSVMFGASGVFPVGISSGDAYFSRGSRNSGILIDGAPDLTGAGPEDMAQVDSIDVLKGPTAVLYANSAISGTVIKNTKKPESKQHESIEFDIGSFGFVRGQLDITGPLLKFDGGELDYRLIGAVQHETGWLQPTDQSFDNRQVVYPSLQLNLRNTIVRLQWDLTDMQRLNYTATFLAVGPNGYTTGPWQGAGKYQTFRAPWDANPFHDNRGRLWLIQKFSDTWSMRIIGSLNNDERKDDEDRFSANPNQVAGTATVYEFRNLSAYQNYYASDDVNGKYHLLGMDQVSTFGWNYQNMVSYSQYLTHTLATISLYTPDALANVPAQPLSAFTTVLQDIAKSTNNWFDVYYMHTLYLWQDKLIAVGGYSYQFDQNITEDHTTRTSTIGPNGVADPYRIGLIYKFLPGLAVYGNRATMFSPQTNRDINGNLIGNTHGEVTEGGLRANVFGGRLSGTIDYFHQTQTNLATLLGQTQANGSYYSGGGLTTNKGWEADIFFEPIKSWSTVFTYFQGDLVDQNNAVVADAVNHSTSVMTKYTFQDGPIKGFAIGGNVYHQGRRWGLVANGYGYPGFTEANAFVSYTRKNWRLYFAIRNLTDGYFADGGLLPLQWIDIAPPRSFTFEIEYRR